MCLSACATTSPGVAFFLTGAAANIATTGTGTSRITTDAVVPGCYYDYLGFPGGQIQAAPFSVADRYCGSVLGAAGGATVCSTFGVFLILIAI
jgi:hypothetical protein